MLENSPRIPLYYLSFEVQTGAGKDILNRISQFWYAIKNALHIYRSPEKYLALLQRVQQITHYGPSGQHSYTRGPLADINKFMSEVPHFKYHAEIQ